MRGRNCVGAKGSVVGTKGSENSHSSSREDRRWVTSVLCMHVWQLLFLQGQQFPSPQHKALFPLNQRGFDMNASLPPDCIMEATVVCGDWPCGKLPPGGRTAWSFQLWWVLQRACLTGGRSVIPILWEQNRCQRSKVIFFLRPQSMRVNLLSKLGHLRE